MATGDRSRGISLLLDAVSWRQWVNQKIKPEEILDLLRLPVAVPYDDYDSDDKNGLWLINLYASFRRESLPASDEIARPIVRFSREYCTANGHLDVEDYYFEIEPGYDGRDRVRIAHRQSQNTDSSRVEIDVLGNEHQLQNAVRIFRRGAYELELVNGGLRAGTPPCRALDDDFAMDYWRKHGYI